MRLVLDASVAIRTVLGHEGIDKSVYDRLENADSVMAPRLFATEVANALWKYVASGSLSEADALGYLEEAEALVTEFVDDTEYVREALSVATRFNHPVYDALYAVVARRHSCPVLTVDERLRALLRSLRADAL